MQYEGVLTKMQTEYGQPIQYYLTLGHALLNMNQLLGRTLQIEWTGYQCLHCKKNKKIWRQGYCWDCFSSIPAAGDWIMKPELSTAHMGIEDRDLAYEIKVQVQPHIVYLALSPDVKVGVTRKSQVPTRWIDQGAFAAITLIEVPNRYLAGIAEVELKKMYTDKTNWRKMLLGELSQNNLIQEYKKATAYLPAELMPYIQAEIPEVTELHYPLLFNPSAVNAMYIDKIKVYQGQLQGIRGQYLIFNDGHVLNIRNAEGLLVNLRV